MKWPPAPVSVPAGLIPFGAGKRKIYHGRELRQGSDERSEIDQYFTQLNNPESATRLFKNLR
jgi:hypothetical protein